MNTTYDVRVWRLLINKNKGGNTYTVRWLTADRPWRETFTTRALAESFRAELLTAIRKGVAFDLATGRPAEHAGQRGQSVTWWALMCDYVDHRWDDAAPNTRRSIADALSTVTLSLVNSGTGCPTKEEIRKAVTKWAAHKPRRATDDMPEDIARTVSWLERHTLPVASLADEAVILRTLKGISRTLDGKTAAGTTIARKRAVFYNVLDYAVSPAKLLAGNPLISVKWKAPKVTEEISPRRVVNPQQAESLLIAVEKIMPRLTAFFAVMYYSALRPAEAVDLTIDEIDLPEAGNSDAWGWFCLGDSAPAVGADWTGNGQRRESRELKHRARKAVRPVPIPPPLVTILRSHLTKHGISRDGHLFVGERGGPLSESVYGRVWQKARMVALSTAETASPLAERPYDLRHACVSTWLNAGVPAPQIAEWAGHSVNVLLRVYAKCIAGQDDFARHLIAEALKRERET
ncbi:site-specific integrase [Streptosporangium sandarakinum]|uniref:Integrase n=1 Tax=Streptosporangium sandarakinum TaxID=1260955 RepID=A0A852V2N8_9ACTN|nr:tyrosine-type recombinase/integrase [Streptosporangium sandarakinum]NYF40471.1 integrase [Streptosporangium sandarakinum]